MPETSCYWRYLDHTVFGLSNSDTYRSSANSSLSRPAILLIHGFGASTDHWRYNIPVLSNSYEVHAIDLLGFGKSAKPKGLKYGGPLWRDQVVAYVNEKIGRPTVLVGNSLGGYAALAAGSALGSESAGVVLLNAAGRFSEENQSSNSLISKLTKFLGTGLLRDPLVQRLIFENLRRPATIRRTLNQVYIDKKNVNDELVEAIRKPSLDPGAFGVFRSVFEPGGPPGKPLDELFEQLQSPLLLLWGNRDPWMNAPGKRATFRRYSPEATTEVVLDAGHCPHDEVPEQVNDALLKWLKEL
ncbi:alpha/beta fold hydrolase [Prochlorococcus sp. MIT 1223]|uniref:alpha/beta fold hydrolase n=1 Tax=Prochlorococcus sp. MIT 1223 TaxID=3096217 RepID=UPI002A755EA7|nr:alpha/beta fold hydrolase [Prochlorococcus sp. MIT 1223]